MEKEIQEELAADPIVQRTGRVSYAAIKRARKAVDRKFKNNGVFITNHINRLLSGKSEVFSVAAQLEEIEKSLGEFTLDELKVVDDLALALARLGERAKDWSERLSQFRGDVVDGEARANGGLLLEQRKLELEES